MKLARFVGTLVALVLVSVACGQTAPAAAPTIAPPVAAPAAAPTQAAPATAPTQAPAAAAKPTAAQPVEYPTLSFKAGSPFAATHGVTLALERFTKNVTERSGGKITFQLFPAGAIVTQDNGLEVIGRNLVDFAAYSTVLFEGELPFFAEASVAPFLYNFKSAPKVYAWVRPQLDQKLAKYQLKVLGVLPQATGIFLSKKIDPMNPDLKGMKLRGLAGPINETLQALGASTVSMPSPDVPVALRTGVVNGLYTSFASWTSLGIQGDAPFAYFTDYLVTLSTSFGVNKSKYDQLPPAVQQLIMDEALKVEQWKFDEEAKAVADAIAKARQLPKVEVRELSASEVAVWQSKVQPAYDAFTKKHGDIGVEFIKVAKQAVADTSR